MQWTGFSITLPLCVCVCLPSANIISICSVSHRAHKYDYELTIKCTFSCKSEFENDIKMAFVLLFNYLQQFIPFSQLLCCSISTFRMFLDGISPVVNNRKTNYKYKIQVNLESMFHSDEMCCWFGFYRFEVKTIQIRNGLLFSVKSALLSNRNANVLPAST